MKNSLEHKLIATLFALILGAHPARSDFAAYNDHSPGEIGPQTHPNATTLDCSVPGSVQMKNYLTGAVLPVTLTVTVSGPVNAGATAGVPDEGTPLADTFNGYVYFGTSTILPPSCIQVRVGSSVTYTFSNLDSSKRYIFKGGAVRGNPADSQSSTIMYTNRWTLIDIQGITSATPNHKQGLGSRWGYMDADRMPDLTGYQVAMNFGVNTNGDMVQWDDIDPGPDGTFAITCTQYYNDVIPIAPGYGIDPSVCWANSGSYGYAISGLRLEEFSTATGPSVSITSPASGATFTAPANILIQATALTSPGTITKVEFFQGATKLGESASSPYNWPWNSVPVGTYSLQAIATDSLGLTATSAVVNISVNPNQPPTVSITSPPNLSIFSAPANLTLQAAASDSDGAVTNVEFYEGATKLGEDSSPPYTLGWSSAQTGNFVFTTVATDNGALSTTSAPVQITVTAPAQALGGLAFNGVNQYVTFGEAPGLGASNFTLEVWFNWSGGGSPASTGGQGVNAIPLIAKCRGEMDGDNRDGNYFMGIESTTFTLAADFEEGVTGAPGNQPGLNHRVYGVTPITTGVWHHAAVTFDGTNWAVYLDGNLETTSFVGQLPRWDSIQHAALGTALASINNPNPIGFFAGVMDEARIWNYARTTSQVATNRSLQITSAPGLIGRWGLNETNGSISYDSSGSGIHGTNINGPVWTNGYPFVTGPTVTLISPTNGATFTAGMDIPLTAAASDIDGTVVRVEFYTGTTKIGEATNSPYTVLWEDVPSGFYYNLRAVATDNSSLQTTSAPVAIAVYGLIHFTQTLVPTGSVWKYLDTGTNLGTAWTSLAFDASAWAQGPAELGYGDETEDPPRPEATVVSYGPEATNKYVTTYFRHYFRVEDPTRITNLTLYLLRDDGAAVYLNGNEIARDGIAIAAAYNTLSTNVIGAADETIFFPFYYISSNNLVAGTNVLAVEIHQCSPTSSDISFDLKLDADAFVPNNPPPTVNLTQPTEGAVYTAPTNLSLSATASDFDGVSKVEFYANTQKLGEDNSSPYSLAWNCSNAASYSLTAVATDNAGNAATSGVVHITVNQPPTNSVAPFVRDVLPAPGNVTALTSIQVFFSEPVTGVDAADLLLNGVAANSVTGSGSNYTFSVTQPGYGPVAVRWATAHGIQDAGLPPLPFDGLATSNTWDYTMLDVVPPTIIAKNPPANATVTNLNQISVTFSESVIGVNASDFLINGSPAIALSGANANYTFSFAQPIFGLVSITWAPAHGITDLVLNPFDRLGSGATWQYTLQAPLLTLVATNAAYLYFKGTNEASTPIDAWRSPAFDASSWLPGLGPFYYDRDGTPIPYYGNTQLTDMWGTYLTIYMRHTFVLSNPQVLTNLIIKAKIDDGFVAWLNNNEVFRSETVVPGYGQEIPYTYGANVINNFQEPLPFRTNIISIPASVLIPGTNLLTIHACNTSLGSSDFMIDLEVQATLVDPSLAPPSVSSVIPASGDVYSLDSITVIFSKAVTNVDPGDLLINDMPAARLEGSSNLWSFSFDQPAFGPVSITWSADHGITDLDTPPKLFNATAPGATWQYSLLNPSAPTIVSQQPAAGSTVNALTNILVHFSENVANVDASDLLLGGMPASALSGSGDTYTFSFPQPPYGNVTVTWAAGHGITDLEVPPNAFDAARPGATWQYSLVDQTPPTIVDQIPLRGSTVSNLTQIQVTFSESVANVNAADLLINNVAATGLTGGGSNYTFTFVQPNVSVINITWAWNHNIVDLSPAANPFDDTAPGSRWQYFTVDDIPPGLANVNPPVGATVRTLSQIVVLFDEPVSGLDPADLLINSSPASAVTGSDAGPYTFYFTEPVTGVVEVIWAAGHGIHDLAVPPNPFAGGEWTYRLDPNAAFAGKVLISEIMYHPYTEQTNEEYIELHNIDVTPINLNGWKFTRGMSFTFSNVTIAPDGYLVVSPNVAAFRAKYPDVTNVVGNWLGQLSNNGERIELVDAQGQVVNSVRYSQNGDWGVRLRGDGENRVYSLTRSGSTATCVARGTYTAGDTFIISGADQPQYNGLFSMSSANNSPPRATVYFTYPVSGSPASPATGCIVFRQLSDTGRVGWGWTSRADGMGSSLEMVNEKLPNDSGQNWLSSSLLNGTPGAPNSVARSNAAPLILNMRHLPPIPTSTSPVTVSALIVDEQTNGITAQVFWRIDASPANPFTAATMYDDGLHNDGIAGDSIYAAILPAQANNTVVEFYVQAQDTASNTRTWPAPALDATLAATPIQAANALYQVDNSANPANAPIYRIIMRGVERDELQSYPGTTPWSNAKMNATFIAVDGNGTEIRYLVGVRDRGGGTRGRQPCSYNVSFPSDQPYNDTDSFNLKTQYTAECQYMGYVLSMQSGLDTEFARLTKVKVNNVDRASSGSPQWGYYLEVQSTDKNYAEKHWPNDADGNLYRCQSWGHTATLGYNGTDWIFYNSNGYRKETNRGENDWSDLFNLLYVLNNTPDSNYVQAVRQVVDVDQWMLFFAVFQMVLSRETSLATGTVDDFSMYRPAIDARFKLLAHDFDTILNQGDTTGGYTDSVFRMTALSQLNRFMKHPDFVPIYFRELKRLSDTVFAPAQIARTLDQYIGSVVASATVANMKSFASNRTVNVLSQIPLTYLASSTLTPSSGYLRSTTPTMALTGAANAIHTRSILINGSPASYTAWLGTWSHSSINLQPGINLVQVQALGTNNLEMWRTNLLVWYDRGGVTTVGGAISSDTFWAAAGGPYSVTSSISVNPGVTLTIEPGATLYLSNASLTIANGGRLLAEGTALAPIRFTVRPGSGNTWGGITINGGAGSPETRMSYVHIEGNTSTALHSSGGTVFLDHLTFGTTSRQYLSLDSSSFIVQDCVFPTITGSFEPLHGGGGIKSGGRGLFLRNFFGSVTGYNDVIDFTGGNRPSQAILEMIDNVFLGSGDDLLDLDGTDAWIEGNIFLHIHKNGSPDTASAVSGGNSGAATSEITMLNNIFYDVDHAAMAKQGNFFTLFNNTVVHQTRTGGTDTEAAVVALADEGTAEALGMYLEGNILYDIEQLVQFQTASVVTFTNNLMSLPWSGPGGSNTVGVDPRFKRLPLLSETYFTNWSQAQVMKDWLSLRADSPARRTGPNGLDKGAIVPRGVSIGGVPEGTTGQSSLALTVGINRTGNSIPTAGWPNGSGFTHYRWRVNGGTWSAETSITSPIILTGLRNGTYSVDVIGKRDSGTYQNDPVSTVISTTGEWFVNTNLPTIRINEILASNGSAVNHEGTYPDVVELYNYGAAPVDLTGMRLTDDQTNPDKYRFPAGTVLSNGAYLLAYANNPDGTSGLHLGYNLAKEGQTLLLYDRVDRGGALVDSVTFGFQLTDLSIGRLSGGQWGLSQPSFGAANIGAQVGDQMDLRINEWLAAQATLPLEDFVELYNPEPLPVALGGLYLTDNPSGWPTQHTITPLTFIAPNSFAAFIADGDPGQGANHLNFRLAAERGVIALLDANLTWIDYILYGPQLPDISQGRQPDGGLNIVSFIQPTPGAPNPINVITNVGIVINEFLASNQYVPEADGATPDWVELFNLSGSPTNLAGMSLTDDSDPRRWLFPSNALLPASGYVRIICDPNTTNAAAYTNATGPFMNTNFALKLTGGTIALYGQNTNILINVVNYGLQTPDFSVGRIPNGTGNWTLNITTPNGANIEASTGNVAVLKINEWAASVTGGPDWFEVYNPNAQPVAVGGLHFANDTGFLTNDTTLPPLSFIGGSTNGYQKFIADRDLTAGADHVDFRLSASGDTIALGVQGLVLDNVTFPGQQTDVSEGRFPDGAATIVRFPGTASPGDPNYRLLTNVVISEVLSHADPYSTNQTPVMEDAIELRNMTGAEINVGGWFLSDAKNTLQKYRLTNGTVIPANGYLVLYEYQFNENPIQNPLSFGLSGAHGDEVYLSPADTNGVLTGYRTSVKFGAGEYGTTFGRYVNSFREEHFVALNGRTLGIDDPASLAEFRTGMGLTNTGPKIGPVVVSEIMYHPPDIALQDNVRDEFIEIYNMSTAPVALFDADYPTNTWRLRDAVDYEFPTNMSIAAQSFVVVLSFDPALDTNSLAGFRSRYTNLSSSAVLVGPYRGKMANSSAKVELYKPDHPLLPPSPGAGFVPYVLVERIKYADAWPWPPGADGYGNSLTRRTLAAYGNDSTNWTAAAPTPGPQGPLDSDGDGIPDAWMILYFGHPTGQAGDLSRANDDADGDGLTNLQEYRAGTSPIDPASTVRLQASYEVRSDVPLVVLQFNAIAGHPYTILYRDSLTIGSWATLTTIPAPSSNQVMEVTDPVVGLRFYRLRTP